MDVCRHRPEVENIKVSEKYQTNHKISQVDVLTKTKFHFYPSSMRDSMRVLSEINASYDPSNPLVRVDMSVDGM